MHTATDFLNHRFLPLRENRYPLLNNRKRVEESFFGSLSNLCRLYDISPGRFDGVAYPYNIATAFRETARQLKERDKNLHLMIVNDSVHVASVTTARIYDTRSTLYYIPVRPLVNLIGREGNPPLCRLLLCLFSWLYKVVGIAYYTDPCSYLGYVYECLAEGYMEEDNTPATSEFLSLIENGKSLQRKIVKPGHLTQFEKRVRSFKPRDKTERELHRIAREAYSLFTRYPSAKINGQIDEELLEPGADFQITTDHYVSFFWSSEGFMYDQLIDFVNTSLQETGFLNEPVAVQCFDSPQEYETHDLVFEELIFPLLENLCDLLNKMK